MMGRPFVFEKGGLKYFDPELVDSFVENKNSDIKVICSDLLDTSCYEKLEKV
jgi:response regulator RpfG family c-di-GMP phosphodiesterase